MRLSSLLAAAAFLPPALTFAAVQPYPGTPPGPPVAGHQGTTWTLRNGVVAASWSFADGRLQPAAIADVVGGATHAQDGRELFRLATGETPEPAEKQTWLALRIEDDAILAQTSTNGRGWRTIARVPREGFSGKPELIRLGKPDKQGGLSDYPDAGAPGTPCFDHFTITDGKAVTFSEEFSAPDLAPAWTPRASTKPGTTIAVRDGWLAVSAPANCAAFLERKLPADTRGIACQVDPAGDKAQSWGPGLALVWPDGKAVVLNIRQEGACSVIAAGNEQVIGSPFQPVPDYNLAASGMKVFEGPKIVDLPAEPANPREAAHHPGKAIVAKLRDETSGLSVMWRAVLRQGSGYVREELTLVSPSSPARLTGVQMLDRSVPGAAKLGSVPGSPVIAGNLFFGAELPVFSSETDPAGFTSGFPCTYRLEGTQTVAFSSVSGVTPPGQRRRGFQAYLERERARPAKAYLHFNGWYDTGTNVTETNLLGVIDAYDRELAKKRGVKLDGYVLDDGWDDAGSTFWGWQKKTLPNGLNKVRARAEAAGSGLGIWISPLGGYGAAPQRIANARKLGLTDGDTLDLSDPRYYAWFRDKCRSLMRDDHVRYFKWDKAGDGVNPHFMALLKLAGELHADDPELFLNVTVGTWASPFWLNHVDCTWHGGGDVAWLGKGDKREQWLTYRDASALSNSKRGPLYPLNSLMLHGLVLGHHYQGKTVAEAGNHLRNECRSFFATGTCMQEVYLSPDLMDDAAWDDLATAAKWAKKRAAVLLDSHMIGGDPAKVEPYGWAAWIPGQAVLALRNPDDQPREITVEAGAAFELPPNAPKTWALQSPYPDQRVKSLDLQTGTPVTVRLEPFEVLVFDSGK